MSGHHFPISLVDDINILYSGIIIKRNKIDLAIQNLRGIGKVNPVVETTGEAVISTELLQK